MVARVAAEGLSKRGVRWRSPTGPSSRFAPIDYEAIATGPRRSRSRVLDSLDDVDPDIVTCSTSSAFRSTSRRCSAMSPSTRSSTRCRSPRLQGDTARSRRDLLLVLRGGARLPESGPRAPRIRGAGARQLLRCPQLGGVLRRIVLLHPEGRSLPDGAVHLLPHQLDEHGPVRAHADRRRR